MRALYYVYRAETSVLFFYKAMVLEYQRGQILWENPQAKMQKRPRRMVHLFPSARMRSEGPSVRLSVTTFSATVRNKAAKKRYQRVRRYTGLILNVANFVKILRSKVMA